MTLLGVGELVGGFFGGQIRDRFGYKAAIIAVLILMIPAFGMIMAVNSSNAYNSTSWLMCLLWGIMDSGLNNFVNCVLGFEFESQTVPFSVYNVYQNFFNFVFSVINSKIMKSDGVSMKT